MYDSIQSYNNLAVAHWSVHDKMEYQESIMTNSNYNSRQNTWVQEKIMLDLPCLKAQFGAETFRAV